MTKFSEGLPKEEKSSHLKIESRFKDACKISKGMCTFFFFYQLNIHLVNCRNYFGHLIFIITCFFLSQM